MDAGADGMGECIGCGWEWGWFVANHPVADTGVGWCCLNVWGVRVVTRKGAGGDRFGECLLCWWGWV